MSILLKRIIWFRANNPTVGIDLTDSLDSNIGRGLDIKNNVVTINLKNAPDSQNSNERLLHKYTTSTGELLFAENDQIKVYLHYSDDFAEIESDVWNEDNVDEPSSDYLKGVYYITEWDTVDDLNNSRIVLKCADKCFILFNRLLAKTFTADDAKTAPEIIQKVIRFSSENDKGIYKGSGEDPGAIYDVDARLTTETEGGDGSGEAGFIQNTRRDTKENGDTNPITTFPEIPFVKVWKPIYEWIEELSQLENINTTTELTGDYVYGQPFYFWVDENNKFHWVETNNVENEEIIIGTTENVYNTKLNKSVFDVNNFIVFRGGEDFYGNGTLDYYIDPSTNVSQKKMRVIAMIDIAKNLIQKEIAEGNLVAVADGAFTFGGNRYDRNGEVTPEWTTTSYTSDSDYNTSLRVEIKKRGETRARNLVNKLSSARYKGTVEKKGIITTVGSLIKYTDKRVGILNEKIRVTSVRDNVTKDGWFTTLNLEQDSIAITGVS